MNKNTTELQKIKEIEGPFPGMSKTSKYLFSYYKYQNWPNQFTVALFWKLDCKKCISEKIHPQAIKLKWVHSIQIKMDLWSTLPGRGCITVYSDTKKHYRLIIFLFSHFFKVFEFVFQTYREYKTWVKDAKNEKNSIFQNLELLHFWIWLMICITYLTSTIVL